MFLEFNEGVGLHFLYVEANDIHSNGPLRVHPSIPTGGGGIMVDTPYTTAQDRWHFGLVRNRIYQNGESSEEASHVEFGGGLFIDVEFLDSLGPFGVYSEPPAGQVIVGNAIYLNLASVQGAGMYFAALADFPEIVWMTNTIWQNEVFGWVAPSGVGMYSPPATFVPIKTSGRSSIVHFHVELGAEDDWLVEDFPDYRFEVLTYTFTPKCPNGKDLFDLGSDDTAKPDLEENPLFVRRYIRQIPGSPSIDAGHDPTIIAGFDNPRLGVDIEGDPRIINGQLDAGADEFNENSEFVRLDANDDGAINISDAIRILNQLFGGPYLTDLCWDAYDANDDGGVNIADAIWGLAYMFSGGPPPPAPFPYPNCGDDPTTDSLTCVYFTSCP